MTGIILHDLTSACVGYDTKASASLDEYMASAYTTDVCAAARPVSARATPPDAPAPALSPNPAALAAQPSAATAAFVPHCTASTNAVAPNAVPSGCSLYSDSCTMPYAR